MLKILDRYFIREIAVPFVIALAVFTFMLQIPVLIREAESLIAQGVEWSVIARVLVLLLPSALSLSIPIAVLFGILVGFGRLSADREFVALQACGVGVLRLLRPVALVALVGTLATAYQVIVALPAANQAFREIVFQVMAERVESQVRPHIFFTAFPHRVIYVRDLPAEGGWRDVFFADSHAGTITVYFAKEGHVVLDRERRLVQLQLTDGTSHSTTLSNADTYESSRFENLTVALDPATVFPPPPPKGSPEMTFAELRQRIADAPARGENDYEYRFMFQQKLALPVTCPILALIGFALGASSRKDGKFASFVLGTSVIFAYYVLLWFARAGAIAGRINPDWAPWVPNVIMGAVAVLLLVWRTRSADRPIRLAVPAFWRREAPGGLAAAGVQSAAGKPSRGHVAVVVRVPRISVPTPRLLDLYISRQYLRVLFMGIGGLLGLFYISTFIDLAADMFRGHATGPIVLRYFFFLGPQFLYYVLPMAVLVAVLVTVGLMSKNNELVVIRACGVSLYRTVVPLMLFAAVASVTLFLMQERVLANANRQADRLNRAIRGLSALPDSTADGWLAGTNGEIYHYDTFDQRANSFFRLWIYQVDQEGWDLSGVAYAERAILSPARAGQGHEWSAEHGWTRDLTGVRQAEGERAVVKYTPFDEGSLQFDAPDHFKREPRVVERMLVDHTMTYGQLSEYIVQLRATGANATPYVVSLRRKIAFPFVTLIVTLLAVPFGVTTGRRGALYGVGLGIAFAIVYIVALSLFGALGEGGMLSPLLAAWAPNILFGAVAGYMLLTVRT